VFITVHEVQRGSGEVGAMGGHFMIRRKKGGMKHGMEMRRPADGKIKTGSDIIDDGKDRERTVVVRGEFQGRSEGGDILTLKPNPVTNGIGYMG